MARIPAVILLLVAAATPALARDWSGPGPFPVGVRTRTFTKTSVTTGQPRVLTTTVWYPTTRGSGTPEQFGLRDAKVRRGHFPLIIYSHGNCGLPTEASYLTMALASWGFVVAAPPHPGNTRGEPCIENFIDSGANRVPDVRFTIDGMLAETASTGSPFARRIRPAGIGITGASFGGFTTLWAAQREPRFTAAMAAVPGGANVIDPSPITIPLMVQGAENDQIVPFVPESENAFAKGSGPRYLVKLLSTSHASFADECGCLPTDIPQSEAHRLVRRYAVPFFLRYLKDGRAAGKALTREEPGVVLTAEPK